MSSFYELQEPTDWAAPPDLWSSTSLDEISACPRRWQLTRSRWGEHERFPVRQSPAAIEGQVVHEALDRLARACGRRGNPSFGTPAFHEAAAEADFFGGFARALDAWRERLARHPRPGPPFQLRSSPQELANRAVRLFREQYQPGVGSGEPAVGAPSGAADPVDYLARLQEAGSLSEVKLRHPVLPLMGVLDRVRPGADGVEIVDFKTGKPSDAHRAQLLHYALLWWRHTGEVPTRVSAQYLDQTKSWLVDAAGLSAIEEDLASQIETLNDVLRAHPAQAVPGSTCRWCPVRARCAEGWAIGEEAARSEGRGDAQLTVVSAPGDHGFLALDKGGAEVAVVYEAPVGALLPAFGVRQVLRVVDGIRRERGKELEIKAWTEVYTLGESCV